MPYRDPNSEVARAKRRAVSLRHHLMKTYGMTIEEYEAKVETQAGLCAACGGLNANGVRLSVDHDHVTGTLRDLLCHSCNVTLGLLQEDPDRAMALANYMRKWETDMNRRVLTVKIDVEDGTQQPYAFEVVRSITDFLLENGFKGEAKYVGTEIVAVVR